jgi:multisubunit Na+/H+ antiporter MnhB subunit
MMGDRHASSPRCEMPTMTTRLTRNDRILFAGPLAMMGIGVAILLCVVGVISPDITFDVMGGLMFLVGTIKIAVATRLMRWPGGVDSDDHWHAKNDKQLFISAALAFVVSALVLWSQFSAQSH